MVKLSSIFASIRLSLKLWTSGNSVLGDNANNWPSGLSRRRVERLSVSTTRREMELAPRTRTQQEQEIWVFGEQWRALTTLHLLIWRSSHLISSPDGLVVRYGRDHASSVRRLCNRKKKDKGKEASWAEEQEQLAASTVAG